MSAGHAVPFYCPYCGEEDIVPDVPEPDASGGPGPVPGPGGGGHGHGHWSCRACLRAFRLSLTAIATVPRSPYASASDAGPPDSRTDSRTAAQS